MKVVLLRMFVNYKLLLTQGMLSKLQEYLLMEQSGMK